VYISLANIAARGYGARPGAHAYFSAKRRRNSVTFFSRANATFYYERRRARARSVEPKRPSASIFCPRQRVSSFSPPLIPRRRGRPLRGAQASRCISLVQLCLVSTRKKNCAVGREKNFLKGEKRSYRGARTKIKKGGEGEGEESSAARGSSISVDRIPKRKRTPASAPIGGGDGPFTKSRDADRRVFMFAPQFLPRDVDVHRPTWIRTSDSRRHPVGFSRASDTPRVGVA